MAQQTEKSSTQTARTMLGISIPWLSLSFVSDGMTSVVLANDLDRLGGGSKATLLGLLSFTGLLMAMIIQPFAGAWSDKVRAHRGRGRVMMLGIAMALPCLALYALGDLWTVAAGFVLTLAAASVCQAGVQGLLPDLIPQRRRGFASGMKNLMDLLGAASGFIILGQVLGSGGGSRLSALVLGGVLIGGYGVFAILVREPAQDRAATPTGTLNPFLVEFESRDAFAWLILSRFLFLLGTYAIGRFFLFFVGERLDLDPRQTAEQAGGLLGILTLLTMLAAPAAGWAADRWGRTNLMYSGAMLSAGGIFGLVGAGRSWQILAFGSLMSIGNACFASGNWAQSADLVPASQAAGLMALANFGTMGAAALAGLAGPVVDIANNRQPGLGYTYLLVFAGMVSLGSIGAVRRAARLGGSGVVPPASATSQR